MKRSARPGKKRGKRGIVLVLLLAVFCTMIPMQTKTEEVIPEQTDQAVVQDSERDGVQEDFEDKTDHGAALDEDGNGAVSDEEDNVMTVTDKMEKAGNSWKYYQYNSESAQWELQKNTWKTVLGKDYYFNKIGICKRIYDKSTKQCKKYKNGEMVAVKNEVCELRNGKKYYFDSKGVRITKKGWKKISGKKSVKIGKKGFVTCRMMKINGNWRYFKYNYSAQKWEKQTKVWKTVNKKKYYFNASGNCKRIYNTVSKKCYDYKSGKKVLVKNAVRSICKKKYYFRPDGIRANSKGLYLTATKKLIYVNANGRVTKEISGEVLEYDMSGGIITSCRVKDSNYIVYYNSQGTYIKRIDLNKPMVALTYDDGPSQYTSAIVDTLSQYSSRATFFVVGERVPAFSDTLKYTYDRGCEIGNHTYNHQILTKAGVDAIQNQVGSTNAVVQSITGKSPAALRPPGGAYNSTVASTVGMPLILWSIDTLDWKTRNASSTQAAVLDHVKDGDIILMHDLYKQTAEASKVIIPELVNRGYQLVTVSELADCRGKMSAGIVYSAFR